ncbi:NosR/NirI family protein [Paracoccus endophyticus]|uniref:NosR/NirI family protein n=1 Tax=Paracoccus endophyticus TaxID=2233774 RepID=UPI000DDB5159|nr:NosR/NirI family protein [Paracoccus endophyticus]
MPQPASKCRLSLRPVGAARLRAAGWVRRIAASLALCLAAPAAPVLAAPLGLAAASETIEAAAPTPLIAGELFGATGPVTLDREDAPVPSWVARAGGETLGRIGSTWELAGSTGYSGRPLDVLVAVDPDGRIAGARLMRHAEPVLTLGISDADIARYVNGFAGFDTARRGETALSHDAGLPDVIARATVSTGVIRDGILRSARILAGAQDNSGGIDRVAFQPIPDWAGIEATGALARAGVSMADAAQRLRGAAQPLTPSDAPFFEMWTGVVDPPTIGRNLLGQAVLTRAAGAMAPGEVLLAVMSRGVQSHRGTDWKRSGAFERITITQGPVTLVPTAESYTPLSRLAVSDAPVFKERSLFRINADPAAGGIDATQPFDVTVTFAREAAQGPDLILPVTARVQVPEAFLIPPPAPEIPLWQEFWLKKQPQLVIVGAMLGVLGLILFGQEWLVRRPRLWRQVRLTYLAATLFVLGWWLNAQLSVVQVVAFLHALLTGFRWETFLVAPLIFVLWSAVALGMLFWGRGVFCGWLCPFGALQELTNAAAQRLGVRQIAVPQALHERLWVIKYTLFVAIVALSFYSMEQALILAEAEPFKTAISMHFIRAWPFVLYALALLGAGLFIERFFCRYICPLGAGLAIPAKLKIFDWLKRRPQCGRECRLCETKCPVGAIDPLGRINPNECVMCLRCQTIMDDENTCPVLKRRARGAGGGGGFTAPPIPPAPSSPPVPPPLIPTQVPAGAHAGAAAEAAHPQAPHPSAAQPPAFRSQQVTP